MAKKALITGITGQDGSHLADLLLSKGYEVYGLIRRLSKPNTENINHLLDRITFVDGDLADQASLISAVKKCMPDEIYNLAAQSFVGTSWTQPELTSNITGLGALRVFEAARQACPTARIYQASSSEMFGNSIPPQNEDTPLVPRSPYGVAKLFAHRMARIYRESYKMHISCGILFNHEGERRGIEFVTRKITDAVARIKLGKQKEIRLGDTSTRRDWGYAPEYVELMWRMLQQEKPDDYVVATGETHTITEFVEEAFKCAGIPGGPEIWSIYVKNDARFGRPAEVVDLRGDYSKAKLKLGWEPKVKFKDLVKIMVDADMKRVGGERA